MQGLGAKCAHQRYSSGRQGEGTVQAWPEGDRPRPRQRPRNQAHHHDHEEVPHQLQAASPHRPPGRLHNPSSNIAAHCYQILLAVCSNELVSPTLLLSLTAAVLGCLCNQPCIKLPALTAIQVATDAAAMQLHGHLRNMCK